MFPSPKQVGLPSLFRKWRPNQPRAIQDGLDSDKRYIVQVQRQGDGKTATYMSQGLIDRTKRYIFLTTIKGLQDQNASTFANCGLVDIRGKSTYQCQGMPGHTCAEGSVGKCIYRGSSMCDYNFARHEASTGRLVQSNYSCWIAANKYSTGFGKFDVMVLDEAHNLPSEIEKAVNVTLGEREICEGLKRDWPDYRNTKDMEAWKHWAQVTRNLADRELQRLKLEIEQSGGKRCGTLAKQYNHANNLMRRLAEIAACKPEGWIADEWTGGYKFDPIDASQFAERLVFRGIPKLIFVSGTIRTHTIEQCNIDTSEVDYFEYPSQVDPARTPIMYIPTTKVNRWSQPWELKRLVKRIDEIVEGRLDRKGIIHTSNKKIRDFIMANSQYARFFESNYTEHGDITGRIVERFKTMKAPAVLVSPSVTTGYDFPYDMCRYQIIAKLNFPYAATRVEEARVKADPLRGTNHAIQQLQQAATRGDRADDDFQEVFILDDAFPTLLWKHEEMFAPSFLMCVRTVKTVPPAPMLEAA